MENFYLDLRKLTTSQKQLVINKLNIITWFDNWSLRILSLNESPYLVYLGDSMKKNNEVYKGLKVSTTPEKQEILFNDFINLDNDLFVLLK